MPGTFADRPLGPEFGGWTGGTWDTGGYDPEDVVTNVCTAIMAFFEALDGGGNHNDLYNALSGQLYEGQAPEGTAMPYATYSIISAPKDKTFSEEMTYILVQFDFFSSVNAAEARYHRFLAYQLFDEESFPITGSELIWMRMTNETGGSEPEMITTSTGTSKVWHAIAEYEIITVLS